MFYVVTTVLFTYCFIYIVMFIYFRMCDLRNNGILFIYNARFIYLCLCDLEDTFINFICLCIRQLRNHGSLMYLFTIYLKC